MVPRDLVVGIGISLVVHFRGFVLCIRMLCHCKGGNAPCLLVSLRFLSFCLSLGGILHEHFKKFHLWLPDLFGPCLGSVFYCSLVFILILFCCIYFEFPHKGPTLYIKRPLHMLPSLSWPPSLPPLPLQLLASMPLFRGAHRWHLSLPKGPSIFFCGSKNDSVWQLPIALYVPYRGYGSFMKRHCCVVYTDRCLSGNSWLGTRSSCLTCSGVSDSIPV